MGEKIKNSLFIKMLLWQVYSHLAFICLQSSFLFQHGKKAMKTYIILRHMFLLLQETS